MQDDSTTSYYVARLWCGLTPRHRLSLSRILDGEGTQNRIREVCRMVSATDYRGMLPAFGVSLRQVAARFVALAPSWRGEGRSPVGALPPYLPQGFYSPLLHHLQRDTHNRENREKNTTHHATLTQHDTTPLPANLANPARNLENYEKPTKSALKCHKTALIWLKTHEFGRNHDHLPENRKNQRKWIELALIIPA